MLHDIANILTAKVELEDGHRSPDMQYRMATSAQSGVAFETAWSETLSHLSSKAKGYILGGVQLVIGFKISYPSPDNLNLHVWRRRIAEECKEASNGFLKEVEDQIIEGNVTHPGVLKIRLGDFASTRDIAEQYPNADLSKEIALDYEDLARYYRKAKQIHNRSSMNT